MDRTQLYHDIAMRTQGDIYIGVVGPVRTGKSTFIKRFLDLLVLPNIENEHIRMRVVDEMPQSGAGRTIMTTQPKFVPNDAVRLEFGEQEYCNVRLVDCVGYLIPGAMGHLENEAPRMVSTPWFEQDIPFEEAAEIGTKKVITEHSTIGIVMTTDGTITDLPRESYLEAEERVISEVRATGKPFVVIINSTEPEGERAQQIKENLSKRFDVSAVCMDVLRMTQHEASTLIEQILLEFPLRLIEIRVPSFLAALPDDHWLMQRMLLPVYASLDQISRMRDYQRILSDMAAIERFLPARTERVSLGAGVATLVMQPEEGLFYEVLSETCGCSIENDFQLFAVMREFVAAKSEYDRISDALREARQTGYGLVPPAMDEMELDEPEIVQQGSRFGVRLRAKASGMHLIRVDIESEVSPMVGTEQQSEALVEYLMDTFEKDPGTIWQTNIFGKPLYDLVREGMSGKVNGLSDEVRMRLQETLQRIVNEGCNGLICIML